LNTEPLRAQASLRYDNLWQRGHSISALVQTAPQEVSSLQVFSGTYLMPVGTRGPLLALYAVSSDSDVAAIASGNVIGKGRIAGARYIVPLPSRNGVFHTATLGIDYKDFEESVRLGSDTLQTPISYVPLSAQYRLTLPRATRSHNGSISANAAPRGLFGNDDSDFGNKRFNARASYMYLRGDWTTEQKLGKRVTLRARLDGQLASQPLISNEQFFAGGAESVRGYYEVERLGDNGLTGTLEARGLLPVGGASTWLNSLLALVFVDAGRLWIIDPLPSQAADFELASAGAGLRLKAYDHVNAALDVAVPFIDGAETRKGEPRVHFRVAFQF
jgi:hemolysin activation/secretion protein